MRRHAAVACAALGMVSVIAMSGCGRQAAVVSTSTSPAVGVTIFAAAERVEAPRLSGSTLSGGSLDISNLRGRVVVLNAWASWCGPCREELPALVQLDADTEAGDVAIVGINVKDEPGAAAALASEAGIRFPSLVDSTGELLAQVPGVPPTAIPSTLVIDRQGRIAARIIGPLTAGTLDPIVERLTQV